MHLIQILLPLYDNAGIAFPQEEYAVVREELTERFGGITTYLRSPAEGFWRESPLLTIHDEIVTYEVMTVNLDQAWWHSYRETLARRFRQELLIVRASEIQLL